MLASPVDAGEPPLGERRQWSWKALPAGSRLLGPRGAGRRAGKRPLRRSFQAGEEADENAPMDSRYPLPLWPPPGSQASSRPR